MKLEASRDKDVDDIALLIDHMGITRCDEALAIHHEVFPDSERRGQARAVLHSIARSKPDLTPPSVPHDEQTWLEQLAANAFPRYTRTQTPQGLTLEVRDSPDSPPQTIKRGLTLQGLARLECAHRDWPEEATGTIKGFAAADARHLSARERETSPPPRKRPRSDTQPRVGRDLRADVRDPGCGAPDPSSVDHPPSPGHSPDQSPSCGHTPSRATLPATSSDKSREQTGPSLQYVSMEGKRPSISSRAALEYRRRWSLVQRRLTEELRTTSTESKLHRLAALMASAGKEWRSPSRATEDEAVRERWMALRRAQLGGE